MKTSFVIEGKDADTALAAARAEAAARGLAMTIAIVDDGGYPLRLERMDGAGKLTPKVALAKARTAALMRAPSRVLAERVGGEPALMALTDYLPMPGGVPIKVDGQVVGAIGISGGKDADDEAVAAAGVAAIG